MVKLTDLPPELLAAVLKELDWDVSSFYLLFCTPLD